MFNGLKRMAKARIHVSPQELKMILLSCLLFMIGALAFVWPNVRIVKMAYEYQNLARVHQNLTRENHLLRIERSSLQSLDRIQSLARKYTKLRPPEKHQVVTIFLQ